MKIAVPVTGGRVSAAFDFARHLLLVEYEDGREMKRDRLTLGEQVPLNRARRLANLGVEVLICGAISRSLSEHLDSAGIDVMPFVSGMVEEVLLAFTTGEWKSAVFLMPGSTVEDREKWMMKRRVRPDLREGWKPRPAGALAR